MANTITYTAALQCEPDTNTHGKLPKFGGTAKTASQATAGVSCPQLATSTTYAAVTFPGLTAARWVRFENIDLTNNIEIGVEVAAAFYGLISLKPGEAAVLPLKASVSVFAKAAAGTAKLNCQALET